MDGTIDHTTLARLASDGELAGVRVVGRSGGWSVVVDDRHEERVLTAQRSRDVRLFRRMETLVSYLTAMNIQHFDVDASNFTGDTQASRKRPDRSESLRQTHEAAAHDRWFRSEVEAAVRQANDPAAEWLTQDMMTQDLSVQRAALQARLKGPNA